QCDSCVIGNDSHSKIDELNNKVLELESLYHSLNAKFDHALESSSGPMATSEGSQLVTPPSNSTNAGNKMTSLAQVPNVSKVAVPRNKRNNPNRRIVGQAPSCAQLQVMPSLKYLHIGKFATATQPEALCKFVADKLHLDPSDVACARLIKKDADINALKFVNFKLGIPEQHFPAVFNDDFWPMSVKVTRFHHREPAKVIDLPARLPLSNPGTSKNPQ
ncbi:hypothetical protein KR067_001013, partial [Drosophila pandora]